MLFERNPCHGSDRSIGYPGGPGARDRSVEAEFTVRSAIRIRLHLPLARLKMSRHFRIYLCTPAPGISHDLFRISDFYPLDIFCLYLLAKRKKYNKTSYQD